MRIVVAGGTGFVGRHISRALLDSGHSVVVLGRDPAKVERLPALEGVTAVRGDVTEPDSLRGKLDGADAVVGAVQFPNYPMESPRKGLTFERFDARGTEHLVAEAERAGVARYLYLSGVGADASSEKSWYRAKGIAESAVKGSGLEHAILRPSWAYGPDDQALNRFVTMARLSPVVVRLGLRHQRLQPVHVDDVAGAAVRIFERDPAWGRTFEVGGPEVLTMAEVIRTMLEVTGRRRLILPVPLPAAKLGVAPLMVLPRPPLSPGGVEFAVQDAVADTAAARALLGFEPVALEEGLRRYLGARSHG